jgi:hypothetical protein
MVKVRTLTRAAIVVLMAAAPAVWYACVDGAPDAPAGPSTTPRRPVPDLRPALAVQERYTDALLEIPGVVGTAVTGLPDGRAGMLILLERPGIADLPQELDGVPVAPRVTGRIMALSDHPAPPAPAVLVGHPAMQPAPSGRAWSTRWGGVYPLQQPRSRRRERHSQYQPDCSTAASPPTGSRR